MSRRKGASFERTVANQMTEWLGFKVSRTPSSGAYGTREGWSSLSGDLMFAQDFPFYCELKCRETFKLEGLFPRVGEVAYAGEFWSWWDRAELEAAANCKRPLLICKRNNVEPFFFARRRDSINVRLNGYDRIDVGGVIGYPLRFLYQLNPRVDF